MNAKTRQKHDYPSAAWRRSYARRTGAERGFATAKDPATNDIARGWCRLMGLTPLMLFITTLLIVRNQRILAAWNTRQEENTRRAAAGLPPKTRRRRRKTLAALATAPGRPSPATRPHAGTAPGTSTPAAPDTARRQQQHACKRLPARATPPCGHETAHGSGHAETRTGMSDPNVKIGLTET